MYTPFAVFYLPGENFMFNDIVHQLDPTEDSPRNSEGAFVTLTDGRIMFAYTRFTGGGGDHDSAEIAALYSDDDGKTWSEPVTVVQNEGSMNTMSVSMLRLHDGRVSLYYLLKNGHFDCRLHMITSTDEGKTWSDPVATIPVPGYFVTNNDRVIQTSTGRLIVPTAYHRATSFEPGHGGSHDSRAIAFWYLSDDAGATWREATTWWALPVHSKAGLQEPGVVELDNGKLFCFCRGTTGRQWGMYSNDDGETWSPPAPTDFITPCSPLSIKRIPGKDKLLGIWNDRSGRFKTPPPTEASRSRTPLVCALGDTAKADTWTNHKMLEDDPDRGFCYIAIHFVGDTVLLAYCAGGGQTGSMLNTLRIRRVSVDWFLT